MGNSQNNQVKDKIEEPNQNVEIDFSNANLENLKNPKNLYERELKAELILSEDRNDDKMKDFEENDQILESIDNSEYPYQYERLEIPKDEEGYVVAFEVDQEKEIKEFFDKYGMVVIKNILNEKECEESVKECWDFMERSVF